MTSAQHAVLLSRGALLDADTAYLGGLMLRTGQLLMAQMDKAGVAEIEQSRRHFEPALFRRDTRTERSRSRSCLHQWFVRQSSDAGRSISVVRRFRTRKNGIRRMLEEKP